MFAAGADKLPFLLLLTFALLANSSRADAVAAGSAKPLAADIVMVEKGQARAVIVVGDKPSEQAKQAAGELQTYLQKMSGARLAIAETPYSGQGLSILVGRAAAIDAARAKGLSIPTGLTSHFNDEGYVVAADKEGVILAGNETAPYSGTLYAVYDFLESLGCRWYFPGEFGEVVPQKKTITLKTVKQTKRPVFRVRDAWYSGYIYNTPQDQAVFATWKLRNRYVRQGFYLASSLKEASWLQNPADDSTARLLPAEKYFKTRPELYALMADGSRNPRFPCPSSDAAVEEAAKTIVQHFQENPQDHAFAFSPPDAAVLCTEPASLALLHGMNDGSLRNEGEGWGGVSDLWYSFVDKLARKVKAQAPDKLIGTMAYSNRVRPPEGVYGHWDNVYVQIALLSQDPYHSYLSRDSWTREQGAAMIREWAKRSAGVISYEYDPQDWSMLQQPKWASRRISEDFRFLASVKAWGFSDEAQCAWLSTGANYWIRGQLAWDVNQDPDKLVEDFCTNFFGPAAAPMRRYYDRIEKAFYENKIDRPIEHGGRLLGEDLFTILNRPLLNACRTDLDEAARLAQGQTSYEHRVAAFAAAYRRVEASLRAYEAAIKGDYGLAASLSKEVAAPVAEVGDSMLLADRSLFGGVWDSQSQRERYSLTANAIGGDGKAPVLFPEQCLFRTDPYAEGIVFRWYEPELATDKWRSISTTRSWGTQNVSQGEGRRYEGNAWYRATVKLPAQPGKEWHLDVNGVSRSAEIWLWVNGRFAGYYKRPEENGSRVTPPAVFAFKEQAQPGDNLIAIRIKGDGGLWLPPAIY